MLPVSLTPAAPPDLVVTAFTISPASPVANGNALATITVRNQGAGPATKNFAVTSRTYAAKAAWTHVVPSLNAGESKTVQFSDFYPNAGTFDSVATVDACSTRWRRPMKATTS